MRHAVQLLLLFSLAAGLVSPSVGIAQTDIPCPPDNSARIDVVFLLDTTGSMSGLIAAAKAKIWSIADQLAEGRPEPHIRMGLVAYRDRGDAYVTRKQDLTDDIDDLYGHLTALQAAGGGD